MTTGTANNLPATVRAIEQGAGAGWHTGAQLYLWLDGEVAADGGIGEARPGVPMQPESVNLWFSSGKPIGAVAAGMLKEAGLLDFDLPVASYWPEFGRNGKDSITLRHILTHTGGFRMADRAGRHKTLQAVLEEIAATPLEPGWEPGKKAGYHADGSWHVLGEVIGRVAGDPFEQFVSKAILGPLRMNSSTFTMTEEKAGRLGDLYVPMQSDEHGELRPVPESMPGVIGRFARPGGGYHGTARDLARLYMMLLGSGALDGVRCLKPETVSELTGRHRAGMLDHTFGQVMDWGLGFLLDNKHNGPAIPYGFGRHASPRTFGHGGRESSTGFADPEHQLVVTLVFNGMPGEPAHDRRLRAVTSAVYEDLGLA